MNSTVYYEISEFLSNPVSTGIQRVVVEIVRFWPKSNPIQPCFINSQHQLVLLPNNFVQLMIDFFVCRSESRPQLTEKINQFLSLTTPLINLTQLENSFGILIPEVFFNTHRIDFYHGLLLNGYSKLFIIGYDMLPWLHPEWFLMGSVLGTMPFLKLITKIPHRCFISKQSALDFRDRILRNPSLPLDHVIRLGADTFGIVPKIFNPQSREFLVIGSIEPRKNHRSVLEAFIKLWSRGVDCRLSFLGRVGWLDSESLEQFDHFSQTEPRFQWLKNASDQDILSRMSSCRATIYPSLGEGYGIPPVESLALGTPVIVSSFLPSIQMIAPLGQIRLEYPTAEAIERGVLELLDDTIAQKKYLEVQELQPQLPRWSNLGSSVFEWMQSCSRGPITS